MNLSNATAEYGWTASPDAWNSLNGLFRSYDKAGLALHQALLKERAERPFQAELAGLGSGTVTGRSSIVKATSGLDNAITLGNLCIKGRFGWRFVHPDRADPPAGA